MIRTIYIAFVALVAVSVPGTVSAYITPGQFLGEEPSGSSSSQSSSADEALPIPNLVPSADEGDVMIPELIPNENSPGVREDARSGLMQSNGNRRPSNFNTQNLPSNIDRNIRIPERSAVVEPVTPEPPSRPTRRAIQESVQPVERMHGAASSLPPSGLPLALPAILTLISVGTGFYTLRKTIS